MVSVVEEEGFTAEVLREEPLSAEETKARVGEFLKKRYVVEQLSAEDYSRLCGLQEALAQEVKTEKTTSGD